MSWSKRINSKQYAIGTAVNLGLSVYAGLPNSITVACLVFLVVSAVANQYFMVKTLSTMVEQRLGGDNRRIMLYLLIKTLFLGAGFICLLLFARDKVLQGLAVYIFQLIILCLSIKNIGKFFKKGPPP